MKRFVLLFCWIIFASNFVSASPLPQVTAPPQSPPPQDLIGNVPNRTTISLDGTWRSIVDPYEGGLHSRFFENHKAKNKQELVEYDFDLSPGLKVPGDWNMQRDSLYFYEGPLWYKYSFNYKKKDNVRPFLYFGAANYFTRVYLNGHFLGDHTGGFTPFNFDVGNTLVDGDNFVVVEVNNTRHADGVPTLNTDWWNYGGITRDVEIVEVPKTYIQDYFIQLAKGSLDQIAGWVKVAGGSGAQTVTIEIPEANIKQTVTTDADGKGTLQFAAKLDLWSPENPKLYKVIVSGAGDSVTDQIGFRSIETRGDKILLNGKPIFLRGISIHEEAPFRGGRAFSPEDDATLLGWAKELGCNFVRLAHYPHHESMVRAADRLGLLVWSEIPVYWSIDWKNAGTLDNAKNQLREEISRDHNRAAIILWSLGNETPINTDRTAFFKQTAAEARSMDATRLLTAAMNVTTTHEDNHTRIIDDPLGEIVDVLGLNEYIGWYEHAIDTTDHTNWKTPYDKPLIVSEFGGGAPYGRHGAPSERWTEEYQADLFKHQLAMWSRVPFLAGMTPWVLMDFQSPVRQLPQVQDFHNRKGLISDRGQKKEAFYVLQNFYKEKAAAPAQ